MRRFTTNSASQTDPWENSGVRRFTTNIASQTDPWENSGVRRFTTNIASQTDPWENSGVRRFTTNIASQTYPWENSGVRKQVYYQHCFSNRPLGEQWSEETNWRFTTNSASGSFACFIIPVLSIAICLNAVTCSCVCGIHMWHSRMEIEYYSVAYFERITKFDVL